MKIYERAFIIGVAILWGFNFVIIRWGVEDTTAISMTVLRFFFTAFPIIFFIKRPNVSMWIVALYGILFGGGIWGLVNIAISIGLPSGITSLLLQLSVFFSLFVTAIIYKEKFSTSQIFGIIFMALGYALILWKNIENPIFLGIVLVVLSALSWTICNVIVRTTKPDNIVIFIVWSSIFVPIPIVLMVSVEQYLSQGMIIWSSIFDIPNAQGWVSILFQAYITTLLGYGVWTKYIVQHGLSNVVPYSLLVPISGLFFGWLLYDENLTNVEVFSSVVIILGLLVSFLPSSVKSNK